MAPAEFEDWEVASGRRIGLRIGDITRVPSDAIVNAANSALSGGGGVDGAIHRAGGPSIMADLEQRYGPLGVRDCPTGSAVVTTAGDLPARWVIHAVGPVWRGGGSGEAQLLADAYTAALHEAARLGAERVTLPAISCGVYGYPLAEAATIGVGAVATVLAAAASPIIADVTFVLRGEEVAAAFRAALRRRRSP